MKSKLVDKVNKSGLHQSHPNDIAMYVNSQGDDITNMNFLEPSHFFSRAVVPKLILIFTARGLSVQPSFKETLDGI